MKRRDILKSCLVAPFLGLFKGKKTKCTPSGDQSQPSSSSCSANDICNMALEKINEPKCPDCPDEDESKFCEDPTCPFKNESENAMFSSVTCHNLDDFECFYSFDYGRTWHLYKKEIQASNT